MVESEVEYEEQREQLLESIEKGEHDLREAVQDLSVVARRQLALSEHIRSSPLPWVIGSFVLGVWLGSRNHSE